MQPWRPHVGLCDIRLAVGRLETATCLSPATVSLRLGTLIACVLTGSNYYSTGGHSLTGGPLGLIGTP